jgi:CRISPR-associated protein Csd2
MSWTKHLPPSVAARYEVHDFHHAAAILAAEFPDELSEICGALDAFSISAKVVRKPGGNESEIPKSIARILRPLGWKEAALSAAMTVDGETIRSDTHLVDFLKNKVAFDLEWNSKDQTFDRDLFAFRNFFEFRRIDVGVLLTRSKELDPWLKTLGTIVGPDGKTRTVMSKFGASTTQMGKLLPRIAAGRNGGCPILILGITPRCVINL